MPRCRSRGTLGKGHGQRDHNLLTEALSWLFLIPDPSIFISIRAPLTTPTSHPKLATIASRIRARPDPCLTLKPVRNTTDCPSAKGQPQAILARNGHLSHCWGLPNHKPSAFCRGLPSLKPSWHATDTCPPVRTPQPQALLAFCRGLPSLKPSWHATDTCPSVLGSLTSSLLGFLPGTPRPQATLGNGHLSLCGDSPTTSLLGLLPGTPRPQATLARNGHLSLCGDSPTTSLLAFCRGLPGLKPSWHATDTCSFAGAPRPETATLSTSTFHQMLQKSLQGGPYPQHDRELVQVALITNFNFISLTVLCPSPSASRRPCVSTRLNSHKTSLLRNASLCQVATKDNRAPVVHTSSLDSLLAILAVVILNVPCVDNKRNEQHLVRSRHGGIFPEEPARPA